VIHTVWHRLRSWLVALASLSIALFSMPTSAMRGDLPRRYQAECISDFAVVAPPVSVDRRDAEY
jgi:hypothetical protein